MPTEMVFKHSIILIFAIRNLKIEIYTEKKNFEDELSLISKLKSQLKLFKLLWMGTQGDSWLILNQPL